MRVGQVAMAQSKDRVASGRHNDLCNFVGIVVASNSQCQKLRHRNAVMRGLLGLSRASADPHLD